MAGGVARPVARATDEDARPVADENAEGPVARGGDAARSLADDSAEELVAGGRPPAKGAWPITRWSAPCAREATEEARDAALMLGPYAHGQSCYWSRVSIRRTREKPS